MLDGDSESVLEVLGTREKIRSARVPGVRSVLVVLSSAGLVFDLEALRQKIVVAYPDAAVFFAMTNGKPMGIAAPQHVDLLLDLSGPGQRQGLFLPKRLRHMARIAIGRDSGWLRRRLYDRVLNEKNPSLNLPGELLNRERAVQLAVLALAGIAPAHSGDVPQDRGKNMALELPPFVQ